MASLQILLVCTGNTCRSPLAEAALRHELGGLPAIEVTSAGTQAQAGLGMDPRNIQIARSWGIAAPFTHRAQQVGPEHLREADLILALARDHRRRIAELLPAAASRTFTLREFAHLAAHARDGQSHPTGGILGPIRAARQFAPPLEPDLLDVVDPHGRGPQVFEHQAAQILPAVRAVAGFIRAAP